ncbi:MAG: hypothetical protein IJT94_18690 [Oscillibacter sp.]|nr:hypothetical protein [Oscillibacter sp.]
MNNSEINALKQLLAQTDWQAIKHSEGEISEDDYTPIREKRQRWRDRINELEAALEEIQAAVDAQDTGDTGE